MRTVVAKVGKCGRALVVVTLLGVLTLIAPPPAAAEPIELASGVFQFTRLSGTYLSPGATAELSIGLYAGDPETDAYPPPYVCGPAAACAGRTFNLSVSDSLTRTPNSDNHAVGGIFQTGGEMYFINSFVYAITAGSVVAPSEGTAFTLFTFSGTLSGTTRSGLSRTLQLNGDGVAMGYWNRHGWMATTYDFGEAPVPEPASLLLLGTGLAGIGGLRRRMRAQRSAGT